MDISISYLCVRQSGERIADHTNWRLNEHVPKARRQFNVLHRSSHMRQNWMNPTDRKFSLENAELRSALGFGLSTVRRHIFAYGYDSTL